MLDADPFVAKATFQVDTGSATKVEILVGKSRAIDIAASVFAETPDQLDFGFAA